MRESEQLLIRLVAVFRRGNSRIEGLRWDIHAGLLRGSASGE